MSKERRRPGGPTEWAPREERRVWPWILLVVLVVGVVINVLLTV
ncbi:hypothetical protein LX15_001931 [Streptoalloteichus tenebrarius]|uniref:Uncharacterized protein n=1 Tax=Streptoalloteichus tenebrarius (strain ATCC 17920 / DSM 40477 / JCM 4838 / CBS 697.72 / NBRC 16177 / NCIMB 11028 / NRRL B-12390 / A12253. 1 / ISP 5477) TaxID=1933 RepID=A0ABT1HRU4_STRSD|nr:hypothetical protein [Streptoalloteichus tenebrarius]MCP2258237.1 hypothetical protein [Streptoalloteichus tenebrarius]BFF04533.1 hypothetical protein GCM10020241_62080 [Streptoalloteichus tenebrarius]